MNAARQGARCACVWRWHFYAGLFVMPMVVLLALTGATFLFKPQIERWEEARFMGQPAASPVTPDDQVAAALHAFPGARVSSYRIPAATGDAALVHIALPDGEALRDVFVSPQGKVLGSLASDRRITAVVQRLHGQLLIGRPGSWMVELAASWAIVMLLTGIVLWWPSGRGLAGVVWPRLGLGGRAFWRDLHAVTGFWVSGLAMVLLLTGLPWADAWGSAFKAVRTEAGWIKGRQDWTIGGRSPDADAHSGHDHVAMKSAPTGMPAGTHRMPDGTVMTLAMAPVSLGEIVAKARSEHLAFPVIVTPPGAGTRDDRKSSGVWSVRSDTQNRPLRVSLTYDPTTGRQLSRETFADKHVVDRVVGYGVAWHEGQLFGLANQLIGVATAAMLVALSISGYVMWRRRKPSGRLGAPALPDSPARLRGMAGIIILLAVFLPMLAASLVTMAILDRLVFVRVPALSDWLGVAKSR